MRSSVVERESSAFHSVRSDSLVSLSVNEDSVLIEDCVDSVGSSPLVNVDSIDLRGDAFVSSGVKALYRAVWVLQPPGWMLKTGLRS